MKSPKFLFLILSLFIFAACGRTKDFSADSGESAGRTEQTKTAPNSSEGFVATDKSAPERKENPTTAQVSLKQADQSQSIAEAMDRKIIRNAELTLEVAAPEDAQRKITSIAETLGGFVVTSESKQRQTGDRAKQELEVNLVIRVPAAQFGPALDQIHGVGSRVIQQKVTGEDVTEEFIDLEARLKTQKALELQFLEIMKQAHKVEDALEVQRQIADVRTEIEKLEGRKRFLENRASLSTITVTLQTPTAIAVNTSGFGRDIRESIADGVDVAIAIVLFLIRFVIVMIPIFILLILPGYFISRYFLGRARKMRAAREVAADHQSVSSAESPSD